MRMGFDKWLKHIMEFNKYTIRTQLVIAMMVVIIPFFLLTIVNYKYDTYLMIQKLSDNRLKVLHETAGNIDRQLSNIESRARQIAWDANVQALLSKDSDISVYEDYKASREAYKLMNKVALTTNDVISILVVPTLHKGLYDITDWVGFINQEDTEIFDWYQKIDKASDKGFWVPTRINEENLPVKEEVATYVSPVIQLSKLKVFGHVMVTVREALFHDILYNKSMEKQEKLILVDDKNRIFYNSDRAYEGFDIDPIISGAEQGNKSEGYYFFGDGSERQLISFTTVPDFNWKLISMVPEYMINRELVDMSRMMYIVVILCILTSVFLFVLLYRGIMRPLDNFTKRMKDISQGNFSTEEYDANTRNEIERIYNNFNWMSKRVSQLVEYSKNMAIQKKDAQLKALQAQINPHFLYNTLDAINWLAKVNCQDDISSMATNLSILFRNILNNGREMVTIAKEIEHIKAFVEIEQSRYKKTFETVYNLDKRLMDLYTLNFILQPFVENAILHGVGNTNRKGRIYIQLFKDQDKVCFEIVDNGQGMTKEQIERVMQENTEGYGIKNVDERIKLKFGEEYGLVISSEKDIGTTVRITIPVIVDDQ